MTGHTSLYYGSVSLRKAIRTTVRSFLRIFSSIKGQRSALRKNVQVYFPKADIYDLKTGRAALCVALKAAGIVKGDKVILSSYTCLAVPTAVIACGATPIYVDIDPHNLSLNINAVESIIDAETKAIVLQHTLGNTGPINEILELAEKYNITVIEDCALSIGSKTLGKYHGSFGHAAIMSMELSKTISCGWGGILIVNDDRLKKTLPKVYEQIPERSKVSSFKDMFQTLVSAFCHSYFGVGKYLLHLFFTTKIFRRSTSIAEQCGEVGSDFLERMGFFEMILASLQWKDLISISKKINKNIEAINEGLLEADIPTLTVDSETGSPIAPRVAFLVNDRLAASSIFNRNGIETGEWFDGPLSPVPSSDIFNYDPTEHHVARFIAEHVINVPCYDSLSAKAMHNILISIKSLGEEDHSVLNNRFNFLKNQYRKYEHSI